VRLSLVVLLITGIAAWPHAVRAAAVGIQFGADGAGIDGDAPPNTSYTSRMGWVAGIQGEFALTRDLSLSLQPSFVQKRSGLQIAASSSGGSTTQLDLSFDYVTVPLVAKFAMARGRTYVSGGVSIDFLSSATLAGLGSDRDVTSAYGSTVFGAVLGFGVVIPTGRTHLTTELRVVQGISNMTTGQVAEDVGALAPRLHSHGLELIVGDLFPVGKR